MSCETRTREGQALRGLKIQLVHTRNSSQDEDHGPRDAGNAPGPNHSDGGFSFVGFARRADDGNKSSEKGFALSWAGTGFHAALADIVARETTRAG